MAKIIFNAALSKETKEYASGIMLSIKGKRDVGVIDTRRITYKNQHIHYAGIYWDYDKRLLQLVEEEQNSNANIGVFISTYETILVDGQVFVSEWLDLGKDIGSIAYKRDIGGYDNLDSEYDEIVKLGKNLVGVEPREVSLYLSVGTAKDRLILKNKEGFYFVCDFNKNNWYVLRPGTSELELFDYTSDLSSLDLLKEKLPFPALDRKLYDEEINKLVNNEWDLKKHTLKYV